MEKSIDLVVARYGFLCEQKSSGFFIVATLVTEVLARFILLERSWQKDSDDNGARGTSFIFIVANSITDVAVLDSYCDRLNIADNEV